jgi:hypothetical protein
MTDPAPNNPRPPSRSGDRTLRGATVTIAVVSLGLSGVLTYQAANASTASAAGTVKSLAPTPLPRSRESDDESLAPSAAPPSSASSGTPVAVSGAS